MIINPITVNKFMISPVNSPSPSATSTVYSIKINREKNLKVREFFKSIPKGEDLKTDGNKYEIKDKENNQEKWSQTPYLSRKEAVLAYVNSSIPGLQKILGSNEVRLSALQKLADPDCSDFLYLVSRLNCNNNNLEMAQIIYNYVRGGFENNSLIREVDKKGEKVTEEMLSEKGIKAILKMKDLTKEKALYLSLIYPKIIEMFIENGLRVLEIPYFS